VAARVTDGQILDAVVATVLEHGYAGATTRQIAAAAGINEITLFRRFGDKRSLVHAAIAQEVASFGDHGPAHTGDLTADLHRVLTFYERVFRGRGQLLLTLLTEVPRRPELVEVVTQPLTVITELLDMIGRYQRTGDLVVEPPHDALNALLGPLLMHTVTQQVLASAGRRDAAPFPIDRHVARFLRASAGPVPTGRPDAAAEGGGGE
jgi:AcrR family transcriptional regulator